MATFVRGEKPAQKPRESSSFAKTTVSSAPVLARSHDDGYASRMVESVIDSGGAKQLDESTREEMGGRFGHDFSRVRIHSDARAAESAGALGARAYTFRNHIVFGEGQYSCDSAGGRRLLEHELTHVVQQEHLSSAARPSLGPVNEVLEREADRASSYGPDARSITPAASAQVQMKPSPDLEEEEEEEEMKRAYESPPALDRQLMTQMAINQALSESATGREAPAHPDMMKLPPATRQQAPGRLTYEALLNQPALKRALRNMAKDLKHAATRYLPGDLPREAIEEGIEGRIIDPVVVVPYKLGIWGSMDEGRKKLIEALQGLPEKAVKAGLEELVLQVTKAVLNAIQHTGDPAARVGPGGSIAGSHDPHAMLGPELTALQRFPVVGAGLSFEVDFVPASETKPRPDVRILGGGYGGRFKQNQPVTVQFAVVWPSKPNPQERRGLERWRVEVLTAAGKWTTGLPGLKGWSGFSYPVPVDQQSGIMRFPAPSLPGRYQVRLSDREGVRDTAYFSVG